MASSTEIIGRPHQGAAYAAPSKVRQLAVFIGLGGLGLAVVTLIANLAAASDIVDDPLSARETLAWSFGLTTLAFGTLKFGIASVLIGVLGKLPHRLEGLKEALPSLRAEAPKTAPVYGDRRTAQGPATVTKRAPGPLPIHKLARVAWAPMLVMGLMAVAAGFVLSLVQAGTTDTIDFRDLGAWTQGLQFLGEAMVLAGISFLLGSILAKLRSGGGEVQESLGLPVKTLKMPLSAKVFIVLMMAGMGLGIAQFALYLVTTAVDSPAAWYAWLGPMRELSLGLLLSGIVFALYTIGTVLRFQFNRVREIIQVGS